MADDITDDLENEEFTHGKKVHKDYSNMIKPDDQGFQQFLLKTTKIISLFLKDKRAPHELYRSILRYISVSVQILDQDQLKGQTPTTGVCGEVLERLFSVK